MVIDLRYRALDRVILTAVFDYLFQYFDNVLCLVCGVCSVRPDIRFRFRFRPIRPIFSNPVPVPVPAKFWPDWPDS